MADSADDRRQLLDWIEADRDELVTFFSQFVAAKSPNPPGDTRAAAAHITDFLSREGLVHQVIDPHPEMPNVVGTFACGAAGRHLVLNGHIDCFPVDETDERWTCPPWSGQIHDDKVYGRGASDMKCGTSASIMTFRYLHRIRDRLKGRLTLTCVSDEETFGPWGARYLMEHHPEVHGQCCLNGEPSSPYTVRFGEKGPLWLAFLVETLGAHGAYVHSSDSATKIAGRLMADLEAVTVLEGKLSDNIARALEAAREVMDLAMGDGAAEIVPRVTLNIGIVHGGLKVNMVPDRCRVEADIRLPVGVAKDQVMAIVDDIVDRYPSVRMEEINFSAPSWCEPYGEMVEYLQKNAKEVGGYEPLPIIGLGGTDARLWRYLDIPAYVYGPTPKGMGSFDEYVDIDVFLHIVRTHVLSAYDYLSRA